MTIERAREILWDLVIGLSDEEIVDIINNWKRYVNVVWNLVELRLDKWG